MKKLICSLLLLLCATVPANSQISLGGEFDLQLAENQNRLKVFPSVLIESGDMEIVPKAGFTVHEDDDFSIGMGCGLFFKALDRDQLRLSLGPDALLNFTIDDDDDLEPSVYISGQVNIDLMIHPRLFIRMSPQLARLSLERNNNKNSFRFTMNSLWGPTFGFYYTF